MEKGYDVIVFSSLQLEMEVGQVTAEDDQVFLMAQQALMVKSPRSASTTVSLSVWQCMDPRYFLKLVLSYSD